LIIQKIPANPYKKVDMKNSNLVILAIATLAGSAVTTFAQSSLVLNLGPLSGSQIVFSGNSFNFSAATPAVGIGPKGSIPDQWFVSSEDGSAATGSAINLDGAFSGGPFNYGSITTSGLFQDATVNPLDTSTLYISDGTGYLQGTVQFFDVSTFGRAGGFVNSQVLINLMGVTYTGANPDLQFLNANQPGTVDLSFQFAAGGLTLQQLSDGNTHSTSYSGSISVVAVPEPSSFAMSFLGGLGALGFCFRKWNNS
jgi:hypothetical protein